MVLVAGFGSGVVAGRQAGLLPRLRAGFGRAEKKLRAVWRASLAYPWVWRWSDRSLAETEVRYATLSSVPLVPRDRSFFFRPAAPADRSRPGSRAVSRRGASRSRGDEGGALAEESLVGELEREQVRVDEVAVEDGAAVAKALLGQWGGLLDGLHPAHRVPSDLAHTAGLHWELARASQAVYLPDPALVQAAAAHAAGDAGLLVEAEVYMARDRYGGPWRP